MRKQVTHEGMKTTHFSHEGIRKPRRSHCMELSKNMELERAKRLSIEERIVAALTLSDRLGGLHPVAVTEKDD